MGVTLCIPLINSEFYEVKHTTFNDHSKITYVRKSGVASKGIIEGLIPNSSYRTRQVFTNTPLRTETVSGRCLCEVYHHFHERAEIKRGNKAGGINARNGSTIV